VLYARDLACLRRSRDIDPELPSPPLEEWPQPRADGVFEGVAENFEMPDGAREFAQELVANVSDHLLEVDRVIGDLAVNWRVSRMAAVDRNILRLATCELTYTTTPTAVVLDEAVELARRYGSDGSSAFVNGVLDAVAKAVREPER
jgi:N utilization substance protein B